MVTQAWTAERFAEEKFDLPDAGRWHELEAGELVQLEPPDTLHGTAVLNFSRELGRYLQEYREGYACYELGLIVQRRPDTVRVPAISYFASGPAFAETDAIVTETRPALVVEVPSTPLRRRGLTDRIQTYLQWGVPYVLVLDPQTRGVQFHSHTRQVLRLSESDVFATEPDWLIPGLDRPLLPGFAIAVASIYAEPEWWNPGRRR
ncbi:MAG: Uma2 family endonuclease [Planctomycetota bacterium]|nr:MAG: Uma2 family endonuclease [Planctomycetota bacterium]